MTVHTARYPIRILLLPSGAWYRIHHPSMFPSLRARVVAVLLHIW